LGVNPLNPNLDFEKSYMTDLLRSMVINGSKIKSIPIHNGWLELDTFDDFKLYEKKFHENTLDDIFSVSS